MNIVSLDNKKSIKQLVGEDINVSITEYIETELAKKEYNFVITADDIPKAKKIMADLNKNIEHIKTFCKDKISDESSYIDKLKLNKNKYVELVNAKREKIKKDVEVFERETKDAITKELGLYSKQLIEEQKIRDNFIDVDTADLIVFSSITGKGALTKKAREAVEARVNKCKAKQDKYDMRLMQLENESRKAGLEAVLTITHVQGIISLDDDNEYNEGLKALILAEMERQNIVKANLAKKLKEDAERESQQKVLNEQNRIIGIFTDIVNRQNLDIDSKIDLISNYEFMEFGQFEHYARNEAQKAISSLNITKQNQQEPEVETVHVNIPFSEEEKAEQIKEVQQTNEVASSTGGKKIVRVQAIFEVIVPARVNPDAVLKKVRDKLLAPVTGISEDTLKSLEVI